MVRPQRHAETPRSEASASPTSTRDTTATTAPSSTWRFLDTEETCHFFNTEIVVGTNDVRQVDLDDASDDDDDKASESEDESDEGERTDSERVVHREQRARRLDPMQTTYEEIFTEFDDLYLPGITRDAPATMRKRRVAQRQNAVQVLSSFCERLQTGKSYLYQKRSEFLRVCFQRAIDLHKEQEKLETTQNEPASTVASSPIEQSCFQFQCSRLERPIDVSIPELHPRKWPHIPYRDPREWKDDLSAIVMFAKRVTQLPEGSLLYEPIDVQAFIESCCELLAHEGIDVWSPQAPHQMQPTETSVAILVAILSFAVRLQSFSLLLFVAEVSVSIDTSTPVDSGRWGSELASIVGDCTKTLQTFLQRRVAPAPYPRALASQWKVCAYQPSTSDAIATDGYFLYIYGRAGLLKIGTGRGSTLRDFVYEHNKSYCRSRDAERSWLCFIDGYLYCRSITMPATRVDRVNTNNLGVVDELIFAPSTKIPVAATGPSTVFAMVTDGTDLFTVQSVDTHRVRDTKKHRPSKKKTSTNSGAKSIGAKTTVTDSSGGVRVGDRVVRGPDWKWGAQDGEKGSLGTVERISTWGGVKGCGVTVRWDKNQRINTYRWGAEGCYDIVVVVEKEGGVLEKKPLPDRSAASSKKDEPITPRHHFIVTRFSVTKLLNVVDLERKSAGSFFLVRPTSEEEVHKSAEESALLTAVHEHTLGMSSATTSWMCDGGTSGCLGDNSGIRYRCERGCDFDLCDICLENTLIGKQSAAQPSDSLLKPASDITDACEDVAATPSSTLADEGVLTTEQRHAARLDAIFTFWRGLYSRSECEIALRRADMSIEGAISWLNDCGEELKKAMILPCLDSFTLESPPNSSGLDPVLLIAGSFYGIDGQLCILSPPGLYQSEKPRRTIHAADAAWFFSLKDGSLCSPKASPVILKSVPAGSPICADFQRRRIIVYSGYLNCMEEYIVGDGMRDAVSCTENSATKTLKHIGEYVYGFILDASDKHGAWQAYKRPSQGLQDWINQLQAQGAATAAAYIRENVKFDSLASKIRARQIKKLRTRLDEFEKLGRSGERGYFVPYTVDFSDLGLRVLLGALSRATRDLAEFDELAIRRLKRVSGIWRSVLSDWIASDVVLQIPRSWAQDLVSVTSGLQRIVFGNGSLSAGQFQDPRAFEIVSSCQDVLLWGIDVGLFEGLDRCDLLISCLVNLLEYPDESLPPNYFKMMHDSRGEIKLQSSRDCWIAFVRRVLALNVEAIDGGVAGLVYQRAQVEDLISLLFKLSIREFRARARSSVNSATSKIYDYTPAEKGLIALFNGCAIDLLAASDTSTSVTPRRRRLSSVVADESMFLVFATKCLQTCEEIVRLTKTQGNALDDARLSCSICGKILPLVLAMACNGGRATLNALKDPLIRFAALVAEAPILSENLTASEFVQCSTIVESSHPYVRSQSTLRKVVRIPGATCLHIEFDQRCSTSGEADFVFVTPGHAWFHSDRVPFGENGIGDAGGCFFGSRQSGNWPQEGKGISIWGDTATIMLCSTSQERQGRESEDEMRLWGLKCVVHGVQLGASVSWRDDVLMATEHALRTLIGRNMSLCDRELDTPLLTKADPHLRSLRALQSSIATWREKNAREEVDVSPCDENLCEAPSAGRYESTFIPQKRSHSCGSRSPLWGKAFHLALSSILTTVEVAVPDEEIMDKESSTHQSIVRAMAKVEQFMIRRVQLLKECSFLQDDNVSRTQMIERLSTDTIRLKELCVLKDVVFYESDPKRSAVDLHHVLCVERSSETPKPPTDYHDEVAREVIAKLQYAWSGVATDFQNTHIRVRSAVDLSSSALLDYVASIVSAAEVRHADENLSGSLSRAQDAVRLVQFVSRHESLQKTASLGMVGSLASCWSEHRAEKLSIALSPGSYPSYLNASWAGDLCTSIKNDSLPYSLRLAAMTDFLALYTQMQLVSSPLPLQEFVAAVSDLLVDVEHDEMGGGRQGSQAHANVAIRELVWIGYRYAVDIVFACGEYKGAVSSLRELVGRLISIQSSHNSSSTSLEWKTLGRAMRIGSSHVNDISQCPEAAGSWIELCFAQLRGNNYIHAMPAHVAGVRAVLAMGQFSNPELQSAITCMLLEDSSLLSQLLERIGALHSSVKPESDEPENKLKDCCVVLLENEKSRLKTIDALETVDGDALSAVYLSATLSQLDLSGDPPHAPITSTETVDGDVVHRNVRCDGCNQSPVRGYRFKCFTCANYDLCGTCYAKPNTHDMDHQFVRLARPSAAGELLQPRSKVNGAAVPEATLVGSKQWMGSVLRALLEAHGYGILCRGSSEDCIRQAKALSAAGFSVTVMEWPDVKDLENFYDWNAVVQATLEPGSARLSRRSSTGSTSSSPLRKVDKSVLIQFNKKLSSVKRRQELADTRSLSTELVSFMRHLLNQDQVRLHAEPLVFEIVEALKALGTHVSLSSIQDVKLFYRTLGLISVLGGYVEAVRMGARVVSNDLETSKNRCAIVKEFAGTNENVSVVWLSADGLSDNEDVIESKISLRQIKVIGEVKLMKIFQNVSKPGSFFPVFAAALKSAHKLLKCAPSELAQNKSQVAATELIVSWLRMFMASMEKLPSLLDSQASSGNRGGNMALLLFQLAKTSKASGSFESLDARRIRLWQTQQVVLSDCQFKVAVRPISSAEHEQDASCVFGPGANGQTDLSDYVFNLYAHSSRSELPKHSGRNKLLEYWEKNVIPAIESYVAGSFKSYEMDYFFAQLREPLREGNPAAAMKIAFTLCDGHVPAGCHYPDPDTDWTALQLDDVEIGGRYIITSNSTTSDPTDWPMSMRWTLGHGGVARLVCPNGLVLMQLRNPHTACLEHWWFQVENLVTCSADSETSVDRYENALMELIKLDLELLGAIARKCIFSMLRQSPDQFPLVSDRQATKNHFNIVDILRMAGSAELGYEAQTLFGESDVGKSASMGQDVGRTNSYDLMESLRFVLTKRFERIPPLVEDSAAGEQNVLSPIHQVTKSKFAKSGKPPAGSTLAPQSSLQALEMSNGLELAMVKYRYSLMEALVQELKRALESLSAFSQRSAFTVVSDSPPKPMIQLKVPGASCMVISFAVHPVLMDLPAGSSLEFFHDERCTSPIFGFFGDKRGLNFLPPLIVRGDTCFVRATQAAYARYKFRVDPLTPDFGLALWIGDELYQRMLSVTLSDFELESIVSSALNSITDYLVNGNTSLPPCTKGVVCQLLTKIVNFAINRSMSNSVPLSKLSALTRDLAVAYEHESSTQKGLFSLPTQQLVELMATVEEVARLRGTSSVSLTATWWTNLVRFGTFTRALTHKRDSGVSPDVFSRVRSGRAPVEAVDEASKMLRDRDLLCERMILLQRLPKTDRLEELEASLSRFIQHLALEECGEADDQTVLSATEVVRFGVLGKVLHLPVDVDQQTVGYAIVDVGRQDIIPRLLVRLQKEKFEFDGSPTEEDIELSEKVNGRGDDAQPNFKDEGGDDGLVPSDDSVWSCGVCTLENPATEVECAACGSPMPSDAINTIGRRQRVLSTRGRSASGRVDGSTGEDGAVGNNESASGWHCDACTLSNPWVTVECAACGSERNPNLTEPSGESPGHSTTASVGESPGAPKSSLHRISGFSLAELLKEPGTQNIRQVTSFLVEQFTVQGTELRERLSELIKRDLVSINDVTTRSGDLFTLKAASYCANDRDMTMEFSHISSAIVDVASCEPIKVYEWLRASGLDLNVETNHYTSLEASRESQTKWTHQMDVQLVAQARHVGARIGVLSLMDLCPSHLGASDVTEGSLLSGLESRDLRLRFVLLKTINKLTLEVLPMVNLRNDADPNAFRSRVVAIRQLLFPSVKIRFFAEAQDNANLAQSNLIDATAKRPVVTLDRRRINASREPGEPICLEDPNKSLFAATMSQLANVKPSILRAKRPTGASDPFVSFIVVFAGENVVGEGGPYRQLFNDIAAELLSPGNLLFIPTPNSAMKIGEYRDRFLPNPSATNRAVLKMYEFVGVLMGCCIRTGVRLNIRLAPIIWKMLVKQSLAMVDLEHIDFSVCESLKFIEAAWVDTTDPSSVADIYFDSFTTALSDGSIVELKPGGFSMPVTAANSKEYVTLVKTARLQECKPQVSAMLRGIGRIVPIHLLQLCTWGELQQWVCGSLAVDVELLKRHTLYSSGMTPEKFPHLGMFWHVLGSFSEENKRRFINFAWGQDTLPADDAEFDRTHTRLLIKAPPMTGANQDSLLPKADTCFFNIELPAYSSEDIMREKLMLAITMCTSMDGDDQTGRMDLYFSTDGLDDDHIE